jgi:hypothetical protein
LEKIWQAKVTYKNNADFFSAIIYIAQSLDRFKRRGISDAAFAIKTCRLIKNIAMKRKPRAA